VPSSGINAAAEETRQKIHKDAEYEKSSWSVLLCNCHKIKFNDSDPIFMRSTFEGKLREELHALCRHRIQARMITVVQRTKDNKPMTVRVWLGTSEH
jgi:hypothetical protein